MFSMNKVRYITLICVFFSPGVIFAQDKNFDLNVKAEYLYRYDRSFIHGDGAGFSVTFNKDIFNATGAFAFEIQDDITSLMFAASAGVQLAMIPYVGKYLWILGMAAGNHLPEYETDSYSFVPSIGFTGAYGGIILGQNLHWSYFYGAEIYETSFAFKGYLNLINGIFFNNPRFSLAIVWSNYNEYYVGAGSGWFLGINSKININDRIAIVPHVNLLQSGGGGLTTTFYGIKAGIGAVFTW